MKTLNCKVVTTICKVDDYKEVTLDGDTKVYLSCYNGKFFTIKTSVDQLEKFSNNGKDNYLKLIKSKSKIFRLSFRQHIAGVTGYTEDGNQIIHKGNGKYLEHLTLGDADDIASYTMSKDINNLNLSDEDKLELLKAIFTK